MNELLLSITIPTYNRPQYLKILLESIKIQLDSNEELKNIVEVVVSDNSTNEETKLMLAEYGMNFKNIKYHLNEKNLGFDLNVLNAVKMAGGKYCWYFGDDDVFINGGIQFVVNQLKTNKYDLVTINSEHVPVKSKDTHKVAKVFSQEQVIEVTDFNEFYFRNYCEGGLSVLIFNREFWLSIVRPDDILEHWLYYETVLRLQAKTEKPMLRIPEAIIQTGQECRWADDGLEIVTFTNSNILLRRMINFGFDSKRIMSTLSLNSKKILIILLRAKGHGLKCNIKTLKYILLNLEILNPLQKILVTLIYFIPNPIIRFIRDSRKRIQGIEV